jgi:prepilin-type N-terminal cleavage/methylation domain-containing protein
MPPIKNQKSKIKNAFTLMETAVALAILAAAMVLVLRIGYWSLRERASTAARFAAIEEAANVLESARATPWNELNTEWAAAQRLPDDLTDQLPEALFTVTVAPVESQPLMKRVTVAIRWTMAEGVQSQPLRMEGWFSSRATPAAGGNP